MYFDHDSLKEVGIFRIKDFISSDECENILNEVKSTKADNQKVRVDDLASEYRVWNAEKVYPSISSFLHSNSVKNISKELGLKPSFCIYNHIWPGEYGSGGGWHRDTRFQNQYKCIIYLSDCFQDNGNFVYLKKSHKNFSPYLLTRPMDLFRKPRYDYLSSIFKFFASNYFGKKGTAMIVNTTGIHRGSPVKKGERHALTIYFNSGVNLEPNL